MPDEFSEEVAEQNFRYLKVALIPLFIFSFICCVIYLLCYVTGAQLMTCVAMSGADCFYYATLATYCLFALLYIRKITKDKLPKLHKNIAAYTTFSFMFCECIFLCYGSHHPINAYMVFTCVSMITILVFHICPVSIALLQTATMLIMSPVIKSTYGTPVLFNAYTFLILNFFMVFSRTSSYIKDIKRSKDLEERNKTLASGIIAEKEQKIQNLNIIVRGMASVIETRDNDTGNHIQRTSEYVKMIAVHLRETGHYTDEITDGFIDMLERAAPMHDIGKIAIPDSILRKPGKLTPEEFDIIKTHTTEGEKMTRKIFGKLQLERPEYRDIITNVVIGHHEKWDGSGYPKSLAGEEIPLCARIMAAADVFDALGSKRCYKDAFPVEEALEIIKKDSGKHFDPVIANAVIELKEKLSEKLSCEFES